MRILDWKWRLLVISRMRSKRLIVTLTISEPARYLFACRNAVGYPKIVSGLWYYNNIIIVPDAEDEGADDAGERADFTGHGAGGGLGCACRGPRNEILCDEPVRAGDVRARGRL